MHSRNSSLPHPSEPRRDRSFRPRPEISKIQVARAPAARRLSTGFPYTHRATITLYVDDTLVVEAEDLANIHGRNFPRP